MRPLHIGLLGAGGIARAHLPGWLELGARVSVYTVDGSAQKLAAEFEGRTGRKGHAVTAVPSLDALLDDCTAVDICTPTPTHKELALAAVAAGRHVVCEKPLALTARDAEEIATAAEAAGVHLHPAHVVRYFPAYAAMQQAVKRGELGDLAALRFTRGGARPQWAPWFGDPAKSGGVIMDLMVHDIDIARWIAGDVVRVHAQTRGVEHATGADAEVVSATAVLTHASGAVSHITGLWGLPDQRFRTTFRIAGAAWPAATRLDVRARLPHHRTGSARGQRGHPFQPHDGEPLPGGAAGVRRVMAGGWCRATGERAGRHRGGAHRRGGGGVESYGPCGGDPDGRRGQ